MSIAEKIGEDLIPVASYVLAALFPAAPSFVWSTLFTALKNGDITVAALQTFMAEHGIKTYSQPSDFPDEPPADKTTQEN